jgi:hypothetical protein
LAARGRQAPYTDPMKALPTNSGLSRLDRASWEKGFSDGFLDRVWWPGRGTEPLSYAVGYKEAQSEREDVPDDPRRAPAT